MDNSSSITALAGIIPSEPKSPPISAPIRSSTNRSSPLAGGIRRATRRSTAETAAVLATPKVRREMPKSTATVPFVCPICFDDTQTKTLSLSCDHPFCSSCWTAYAVNKIKEEGEITIRCMGESCSLVAPDTFVRSVLEGEDAVKARFHELTIRNFVSSNPNLKYCPYPSCTYTISCPSAAGKLSLTTMVPTVACGASSTHKFCFGCTIDGDHRPVVCGVAKMWLKKCHDDSETANWIKSNTKECAKCQSTIEKNGGCK